MADNKLAEKALNQGAEAWAAHVAEHGKPTSLTRVGIEHSDLSGADLSDIDLSEAVLNDVKLNGADLNGSKFKNAHIAHSDLDDANLQGADLTALQVNRSSFKDADLQDSTLDGSNFYKADLSGANLSNTKASPLGAGSSISIVGGSKLNNANIQNAQWDNAQLEHTDVTGIQAKGASLQKSSFHNVKSGGGEFSEANVSDTELSVNAPVPPGKAPPKLMRSFDQVKGEAKTPSIAPTDDATNDAVDEKDSKVSEMDLEGDDVTYSGDASLGREVAQVIDINSGAVPSSSNLITPNPIQQEKTLTLTA